jgi:hypothetical protein
MYFCRVTYVFLPLSLQETNGLPINRQKYRKELERTENTVKDGKDNCPRKSSSFQEMQVEGQLSKNRNLILSRRQHGFQSRWG